MDEEKRKRLEEAGWKIGSAQDFLELNTNEVAYIELKLSLARQLRIKREKQHMTQAQVAREIGSSQSRVAKMEKGDPSVSLDLLIKTLLALDTSRQEIGKVIAEPKPEYGEPA